MAKQRAPNGRTTSEAGSKLLRKRKQPEESSITSTGPTQPSKRSRPNAEYSQASPDEEGTCTEALKEQLGETTKDNRQTKGIAGLTPNSSSLPAITKELARSYELRVTSIISSSKIQKKVKAVLEFLTTSSEVDMKPRVIILHSKAAPASKLITIAEIAKRELGRDAGVWFQYSAIGELVTERQADPTRKLMAAVQEGDVNEEGSQDAAGQDEEEEGFETMKTPFERAIEGKPKIRVVPTLTIYLSRFKIEKLRSMFG